jgi:DNA processing protein
MEETGRRAKAPYQPPARWQEISVEPLLEGSPRGPLSAHQLSLLASTEDRRGKLYVYASGDTSLLKRRCVSVIGNREVSPDGAARARRVAKELVLSSVVVVSGLAKGVDTEAMATTLRNDGKTIGVIGTPLDKAYPAENKRLQEQVYRDHLLISPFAFGQRVFRSNFPVRNRLMAVLSDATVVIEASDTSGTLHQAAECVRLKRWLFIAKSVVDNPTLSWPSKFLPYERCRVLESTEDMITAVYGP